MNGKLLDTNVIIRYIKADGHPIPENDMWIAACAMTYNLTVVTADKHFSFIKGITTENR